MCECYKIGGPFVSYDPECAVHAPTPSGEPTDDDVEVIAREMFGALLLDIAQEPWASMMRSAARTAIRLGADPKRV